MKSVLFLIFLILQSETAELAVYPEWERMLSTHSDTAFLRDMVMAAVPWAVGVGNASSAIEEQMGVVSGGILILSLRYSCPLFCSCGEQPSARMPAKSIKEIYSPV